MISSLRYFPALVGALLAACGGNNQNPSGSALPAPSGQSASEPKITQLYAPAPTIGVGDLAKICYGVENARTVYISPPMQELSAALARCIEVDPKSTTTYTLTAEGSDGKRVTQDVTITVGTARARIVNVNISALEVKPGDTVSICYTVSGAASVTVDPPGYHGGSDPKGCATHQPVKTTTYTVAVTGASGDRDQEQVTVKVR